MANPSYEELQQENRRLPEELEQLRARVAALEAENAALRDRLAQAQEKKDPPPFVKPRHQAQEPKSPAIRGDPASSASQSGRGGG